MSKTPLIILISLAYAGSIVACATAHEHAGKAHKEHAGKSHKEHAGHEHKEHAGGEHKEHAGGEHKEHAGDEHKDEAAAERQAPTSKVDFSAAEVKSAMMAHIDAETEAGNGVLKIEDNQTGVELALEFIKIHDPVRIVEGKGYFACTDFHPQGAEASKLYDLDFWLSPKDGKLVITDTKIHKHPKRQEHVWVKHPRYTFVNDQPVEVN